MKIEFCPESACKGEDCPRYIQARAKWTLRTLGITEAADVSEPREPLLRILEQELTLAGASLYEDGPLHLSPEDAEYEVHSRLVENGTKIRYIAIYSGDADPMTLVEAQPLYSDELALQRMSDYRKKINA